MMGTNKRRQSILALLRQTSELPVDELAAQLGVSPNTIRNDFNALAASGQLQRVRGGARALASAPNDLSDILSSAFLRRRTVQSEAKHRIARRAADLVADGDAIILDASTTVFYLGRQLHDRQNLTIVTSGVEVGRVLAQNPSNTVLLLGGILRRDGMLVSTAVSEQFLKDLHIRTAFVSCAGFTPQAGLTETNLQEAQLKRQMIAAAGSVIALIDASKFGQVDLVPFATTEQVARIYTDDSLDARWVAQLQQSDCAATLVTCGESAVETYSSRDAQARVYRIGFANLTERMPFAQQVRQGLEQAAAAHKNVELLVFDNDLDREEALVNVDRLITQKMDLVIEYQIDAAVGNIIMDRFRRANIPVIAVDIPLPGASFFGADNYRAGHLAGEGLGRWIQRRWQGQFDYLLCLQDTRAGTTPAARIQGGRDGLEAVLGPLPEARVLHIETSSLRDETQAIIQKCMPGLPAAGRLAIIAVNDDVALGALDAFAAAGWLERVVAVGQNADRLGRAALARPGLPFAGSTSYAPERYGERLLELALKTLRGEPVPPAVYVEHAFVSAEEA